MTLLQCKTHEIFFNCFQDWLKPSMKTYLHNQRIGSRYLKYSLCWYVFTFLHLYIYPIFFGGTICSTYPMAFHFFKKQQINATPVYGT